MHGFRAPPHSARQSILLTKEKFSDYLIAIVAQNIDGRFKIINFEKIFQNSIFSYFGLSFAHTLSSFKLALAVPKIWIASAFHCFGTCLRVPVKTLRTVDGRRKLSMAPLSFHCFGPCPRVRVK